MQKTRPRQAKEGLSRLTLYVRTTGFHAPFTRLLAIL